MFNATTNPQQGEKLKKQIIEDIIENRVKQGTFNKGKPNKLEGKTYKDVEEALEKKGSKFLKEFPPFNDEAYVNKKFIESQQVKKLTPVLGYNNPSLRVGALGFKVGMMSTFDMWGYHMPLTVIQLDRCQITQIKETADPQFFAVQVGAGAKSLHNIRKPQIGHFLKNNIIPSRYLREFKVSRANVLPVGYRIGARHFTPGQLVDVRAVAKDKGFQGAMKKWGFGGQPASHGVSLAHRSLGSTGQKQWPSKVFKGKRMHGHMGGHPRCQFNLKVFRIDYERCLVYILGSVPGKTGELVEIMDSRFSYKTNHELLNYPTFVPVAGESYANVIQVEPPIQDPSEVWLHDNVLPKDNDEEEAAASVSAATADLDD
jgi:large subunit ribosomal protein L3